MAGGSTSANGTPSLKAGLNGDNIVNLLDVGIVSEEWLTIGHFVDYHGKRPVACVGKQKVIGFCCTWDRGGW